MKKKKKNTHYWISIRMLHEHYAYHKFFFLKKKYTKTKKKLCEADENKSHSIRIAGNSPRYCQFIWRYWIAMITIGAHPKRYKLPPIYCNQIINLLNRISIITAYRWNQTDAQSNMGPDKRNKCWMDLFLHCVNDLIRFSKKKKTNNQIKVFIFYSKSTEIA